MAATQKPKRSTMTDTHKAALAEGREQGRAIRAYLEALEHSAPKRGRKRTAASIDKRLAAIDAQLGDADPLRRVNLIQERLDLTQERESLDVTVDLAALEAGFIAVAKPYSERKGISKAAWREIGITPAVLKAAGI